MITNQITGMQTTRLDDVQLVRSSLAGDCRAFSQIVERYQNLVCSIAYSATGSLGRSEDLAQETFLAAWLQLRELREPAKLRAWLCGIARNLIHNSFRREQRDASYAAEPLEAVAEAQAPDTTPADQVINAEEETILWQSLEHIPEIYREPLILFYRENMSAQRVAEVLELSPDTARQRLSRGRRMLEERIAAFVEGALARSAPKKAFTLAVLAALPVVAPSAAAAATVASTAGKSSAAAKAASAMSGMGAILGPIVGLLGAYLGIKASIQNTRSIRERQFMIRMSWVTVCLVAAFLAIMFGLMYVGRPLVASQPVLFVAGVGGVVAVYIICLIALIFYTNKRQRQIRIQDGTCETAPGKLVAKDHAQGARGYSYKSKIRFLGLPLVHINMGGPMGDLMHRSVACGWIAFGSVAVGLIAFGGAAFGGLAMGGLSIGLVAVAGVAIGVYSLGGVAAGYLALGGFGLGWQAALGGIAVARNYALGGLALAAEANTDAAKSFIEGHDFFFAGQWLLAQGCWVWLLPLLIIMPIVWRHMARIQKREQLTKR